MGKASKWFRGLLGMKKPERPPSPAPDPDPKPPPKSSKWSFAKPHREKHRHAPRQQAAVAPNAFADDEATRHAVAVAAATAAVAEAALAAAHAAAAVVRLTSSAPIAVDGVVSRFPAVIRHERAAVKIQSHFRGYLARRALRALRALVKLQALAKGVICRKQFTEYLQQMQAIARAQERARACRISNSETSRSSTKSSSLSNYHSPSTPEKFENIAKSLKHQHPKSNISRKLNESFIHDADSSCSTGNNCHCKGGRKSNEREPFTRIVPIDEDIGHNILHIDNIEPHYYYSGHLQSVAKLHGWSENYRSSQRNTYIFPHNETQFSSLYKHPHDRVDETSYSSTGETTAHRYYSSSSTGGGSKRAPPTPAKADGSKSYMACTESSKAKVRSASAPRQMPPAVVHDFDNESRVSGVERAVDGFTSKGYWGSGRLDRLGMLMRDGSGF